MKKRPGYTEEQVDNEAVLLRAYGRGTEVLIDRDRTYACLALKFPIRMTNLAATLGETASHSLLSRSNLAPPLLARFQNGLLYKFIRGQPCKPEDLSRDPISRGIARRLAQWHALLPIESEGPTVEVIGRDEDGPLSLSRVERSALDSKLLEAMNAITPGKATPNIWTVMQKWIFALPCDTEAQKSRQDTLQKELERTVKDLGKLPGLGHDGVRDSHITDDYN